MEEHRILTAVIAFFGQLVDQASYEALDNIANVDTGAADKPIDDIVIESIEVIDDENRG